MRFGVARSTGAAVLLVVLVTAACTVDTPIEPAPPPPLKETVAPPDPAPTLVGTRYDPLPAAFCEQVDWDTVADSLGLTLSKPQSFDWTYDEDRPPPGGVLAWFASCGFDAETLDQKFRPMIAIRVEVYDNERRPRQMYQGWVAERRHRGYEIDLTDGWWDDGAWATKHSRSGDYQFALTYHHIRHHNLYLETSIDGGYRVPDTTDEEFLDLLNQMSLALIDEVMDYLPCRPTAEASPTPDCKP